MKTKIVTKDWLAAQVAANPSFVIGRALLAIYNNQTHEEQAKTVTKFNNGIGFTGPDTRLGSIGARMFKAHSKLEQWLIDIWLRPAKTKDRLPRICKYAEQLNSIALQKQQIKKTVVVEHRDGGVFTFINQVAERSESHY